MTINKRRSSRPIRPRSRSEGPRAEGSAGIRKGELFIATVRDLASDGRGIVTHPSGLTVFVPGVWAGEQGRFRITELKHRIGSAELVELLESSSARTSPQCPHHGFRPGDCGGCPWQFMDYTAQLAAKQARVDAAAEHVGAPPPAPVWPSPNIYGYRNRAQLKTDGDKLGYVSAASHQLAAIEDCPILTDINRATLRDLRARLPNPAWRPGKKSLWTSLDLDESRSAETVQVNARLTFQQANTDQNLRMRQWLAERVAALPPNRTVLELFCGAGNFTEVLSESGCGDIVAVDGSGPAVEELASRALPGVSVMAQDLFKPEGYPLLFRQHRRFDALVLDPPRDGMKDLPALLQGRPKPKDIFYISCNPATLFRDLAALQTLAYRIREIQPLDQAPHTPHLEVLVHLQLK